MGEQDEIQEQSMASNVQMHEITPIAEGMSFGALLDKFYMSIEAADTTAKQMGTTAQDLVNTTKKSGSGTSKL